jgi:hypothetical protein
MAVRCCLRRDQWEWLGALILTSMHRLLTSTTSTSTSTSTSMSTSSETDTDTSVPLRSQFPTHQSFQPYASTPWAATRRLAHGHGYAPQPPPRPSRRNQSSRCSALQAYRARCAGTRAPGRRVGAGRPWGGERVRVAEGAVVSVVEGMGRGGRSFKVCRECCRPSSLMMMMMRRQVK